MDGFFGLANLSAGQRYVLLSRGAKLDNRINWVPSQTGSGFVAIDSRGVRYVVTDDELRNALRD